MEMKRRSTIRHYLQRATFLVLLLLLNGLSATTTSSQSSQQQQERSSLPPPTESEKLQTKAFLILCTSDGKLYTLDAWTGSFHAVETAGPPLVTRSSSTDSAQTDSDVSGDDSSSSSSSSSSSTSTAASIVPGLDGRLYWQQSKEDGGELQLLDLTISSLMSHPVRTCNNNDNENNNNENTNETTDCGILTASAHTRLLALNEHGRLVWTSDGTTGTSSTTSQERTSNPKGQPDQTVLLQRKDYWVQQVSSRSGQQVWNVSLGTYQALAFDDEEDQDEALELREEQLLLPGRVQDKKETLYATVNKKKHLPAIQFSDSGRTLSAIDPNSLTVLWRVETPNVLVSVFGLYKGKWRSLHIVEEEYDADTCSTGPATRLLAASSNAHDDPPIPLDWWFPQKYATHHSLFLQQGLLPSALSNTIHEQEEVCLSEDCPNFRQLPLRLPAPPPVIVAPQGLVLSWSVVLVVCWTTLLAVIGGRLWYLRKKYLWVQRTGRSTRQHFSDSNSSSNDGNGNNHNNRNLKHSASLPELGQDATRKPRSRSDPLSVDLMPTPRNTTGSPSAAQAVVPPVLQQLGGIPLVRYSRYASEFEELAALGKGGFGTVFKCRNVLDGRDYAVKKVTIVGETTEDSFQQRLQRVLREVKILAVLDHPNIVRYYTAWLEIDKEVGGGEEGEEVGSQNAAHTNGETSMSRRHSDSSYLTDSVTQWTVDETPLRATRYLESLNNPLGWKHDFGLSEEGSLPARHRFLQQEGSTNDCDSIFERSEESKSISEVPMKSFSRDPFLQEEGSINDCDSTFERSEDNESKSEVPRNTFSRDSAQESSHTSSQSASHSLSKLHAGAERNSEQPASNSSKAAVPTRHTLYIQMQLCTQKTVGDFLSNPDARKGSAETGVDIPAALSLFLQIVQAVRHVHSQGLIHRDLKPLNCFMDESGTIKVGDFGLSREATDKAETPGATAVFNVDEDHTAGVGTRSYASPEQMEGSNYDSSTDVFSLGVGTLISCISIMRCVEMK
jgi:serine/threonine protein kinase